MLFKTHKRFASALLVTFVLAAIAAGPAVEAQEVAVGGANATVLAVLAVTSVQDLNFGNVLQGVPASADIDVIAEAGDFQVTGAASTEVALYLQLPEFLWNSTNTDRMIISFGSTDCEVDTLITATAAAKSGNETVEDPYNITAVTLGGGGGAHLFLAGSVYPAVDQAVGAYAGDIVLTAAYTGN
ncbi:MAG: hypothetical protein JSV52_07850 [Candidatus Zixiibacteriota bacterium]|nr:MAG: hypothetical protein JSV52_07850 [candidate division Zixibacteria bacterium]